MNMEVNYLLISFLYNWFSRFSRFQGDYKYNYIFNVLVGTYEKGYDEMVEKLVCIGTVDLVWVFVLQYSI
jgi:hypothetical protein